MTAITPSQRASLPAFARSSINRCNLPAVILGGLTFQQQPSPLLIDGVLELHQQLFQALDDVAEPARRALHFQQYMRSAFLLECLNEAGFDPASNVRRDKADYLRLLRGWMFNADGVEAAVLKQWVESRFGLRPRSHAGRLEDFNGATYRHYLADVNRGLYNSNALEAQLDLLYSYCQYELNHRWPGQSHWLLYRGVNQLDEHDLLGKFDQDHCVLLLNNLNSFSSDRLHSESFGDYIMEIAIPSAKLLYFPGLLPGVLQGEGEYLVIGGVYRAKVGF
ncbi:NAD(+)--dinitrogen-reductase ADP-D-ribosyltransferase [Halioxenophilus sp. WMMB6]|uniref:NAD(+)--dinitrogen-reductase ADP-D-ribosyltransferase n=1 Tax=Halioxenophilus sp. WMMB6 TaxID=3073815 RepID=UPI00295F1759|nr:NAD(+)--dinitrogen-reductase ADP-D-ribosyltransferase [Halioxenophilus sp. WMMB6]